MSEINKIREFYMGAIHEVLSLLDDSSIDFETAESEMEDIVDYLIEDVKRAVREPKKEVSE